MHEDVVNHLLATSILDGSKIEALSRIVGLMLDSLLLSHEQAKSIVDQAREARDEYIDSKIALLSEEIPELGAKIREIISGDEDFGLHFGNGKPR